MLGTKNRQRAGSRGFQSTRWDTVEFDMVPVPGTVSLSGAISSAFLRSGGKFWVTQLVTLNKPPSCDVRCDRARYFASVILLTNLSCLSKTTCINVEEFS